jgi:16S rRNA (adenine1518-N6/adenine1519-N6)-dimethyltransferase
MTIEANKSLGQHWLDDIYSLESMIEAVDLNNSDNVLEVGPGLGSLTKILVTKANHVTTVEIDRELINRLKKEIKSPNLTIVDSDILKFNLESMPKDYKVIANIPYYLTSKLFRVLSESNNPFSKAAILVQKEVAQRIEAGPGSMSLLSVSVQYYNRVSLGIIVPALLFDPPPKVDSQVVILKRREKPLFENMDSKQYFKVVKAGFGQRRKKLVNSLSSGLGIDKITCEKLLNDSNISPDIRAQELTLDNWASITNAAITESII